MTLPDFAPSTETVRADYLDPEYPHGSFYAPIQKLRDGRVAVDIWVGHGSTWAKAWKRSDHPNIASLPKNAPRVVKALYRAENQLKLMRQPESNNDVELARDAWRKYWRVVNVNQ